MRDIDLMVELLERMNSKPDGQILLLRHFNMSEEESKKYHNAELLSDAGLAIWKSDSAIRISNDGYDFLNAVKQEHPKYIDKAKELLGQGKTLLAVAKDIISIVNALAS
ncbi:MAG: hypothetical protein OXI87_19360 [Albidovulum sp.]|nr:hypothetical protein [Albidovulum sp.]